MRENKFLMLFLRNIPLVLFVLIFLFFGILTPAFLSVGNMIDILTAVAYVGILAVGMTFVIITGGIDLSIGSVVYLSTLIPALMMQNGISAAVALPCGLIVGLAMGAFNAFFIVKMRMIPFLVTLCTMVAGRGLAIFLCKSQGVRFPDSIISFGLTKWLGLPFPIYVLVAIIIIALLIQTKTPVGRKIYAVGNDVEIARKAGINTQFTLTFAYMISGLFAAIGGIMCVFQMGGLINPSLGEGIEFNAIAAAVLGGTSLMGGVGKVFPGTILGALIMQMLTAGLIYLGVDMYFQPIFLYLIIFIAVFIDSLRTAYISKIEVRNIRVEEPQPKGGRACA